MVSAGSKRDEVSVQGLGVRGKNGYGLRQDHMHPSCWSCRDFWPISACFGEGRSCGCHLSVGSRGWCPGPHFGASPPACPNPRAVSLSQWPCRCRRGSSCLPAPSWTSLSGKMMAFLCFLTRLRGLMRGLGLLQVVGWPLDRAAAKVGWGGARRSCPRRDALATAWPGTGNAAALCRSQEPAASPGDRDRRYASPALAAQLLLPSPLCQELLTSSACGGPRRGDGAGEQPC